MELYVGNLSKKIEKEDLEKAFGKMGTILSLKLKKDLFSGKPKGYAFIEMPDQDEAKKAIEKLNGKKIKGQEIVVKAGRTQMEDSRKGWRKGNRPF